jgi:6,7-dimethyl-8-ribityllumazine synthase
VEGSPTAPGYRFAVVVSRFNEDITNGLLNGALEALREASVGEGDVEIVRVPGAFEIPLAALHLAETGRFDAIICLGCLIKGDTMHFEYIASATTQGIMDAATRTGIPLAFGVLTTLTDEQAAERAAPGPGNKGREAALAAVEMAVLLRGVADSAPGAAADGAPAGREGA